MKIAKRLEAFDAYLGTAMNVILTRMKDEGKDVITISARPWQMPVWIWIITIIPAFIHRCRLRRPSPDGTSGTLM